MANRTLLISASSSAGLAALLLAPSPSLAVTGPTVVFTTSCSANQATPTLNNVCTGTNITQSNPSFGLAPVAGANKNPNQQFAIDLETPSQTIPASTRPRYGMRYLFRPGTPEEPATGGRSQVVTGDENFNLLTGVDYTTNTLTTANGGNDSDTIAMLAGAICAAMVKRLRTGKGSEVDVSLLGTAMWSMQRLICQSTADEVLRFPRPADPVPFNVLVGNYRTSDGRFVALCMLQADKYWKTFCEVAGRPDLASDPRYVDDAARRQNREACWAEVKALFATRTLAEWREILSRQEGQWDVVQEVGEMHADPQVQANGYLQRADYGDGTSIPMVAVPMLFDKQAMPARRSPDLGADSDAVLASLGYDEDAIIDLKVQGVVF